MQLHLSALQAHRGGLHALKQDCRVRVSKGAPPPQKRQRLTPASAAVADRPADAIQVVRRSCSLLS